MDWKIACAFTWAARAICLLPMGHLMLFSASMGMVGPTSPGDLVGLDRLPPGQRLEPGGGEIDCRRSLSRLHAVAGSGTAKRADAPAADSSSVAGGEWMVASRWESGPFAIAALIHFAPACAPLRRRVVVEAGLFCLCCPQTGCLNGTYHPLKSVSKSIRREFRSGTCLSRRRQWASAFFEPFSLGAFGLLGRPPHSQGSSGEATEGSANEAADVRLGS